MTLHVIELGRPCQLISGSISYLAAVRLTQVAMLVPWCAWLTRLQRQLQRRSDPPGPEAKDGWHR